MTFLVYSNEEVIKWVFYYPIYMVIRKVVKMDELDKFFIESMVFCSICCFLLGIVFTLLAWGM